MSHDGRFDNVGPGNSGFVSIKSNCKTQIFLQTLLKYIGLVLRGRSDQVVWNMFLREYDFRQIVFELLNPEKFVSGYYKHCNVFSDSNKCCYLKGYQWGNPGRREMFPSDPWIIHAAWTNQHFFKITKFKKVGYWYLNETCPFWIENIIPEHKESASKTVKTWNYKFSP